MSDITFLDVKDPFTEEIVTHVIIDRGNGEFTSMLKEHYEAQQVEHLTEISTGAN